ncbi:hypothetical protein COV25_00975 [candidate division WWE3 bacterium CG10_big_fil_rev_8_21_14_0_10_35_32]|nr:MAG: hypothetical protein COV25_00975 [candidate division WWE3 bacterium CG10_big_fil_rev_8_21_14_0_10_35_32]
MLTILPTVYILIRVAFSFFKTYKLPSKKNEISNHLVGLGFFLFYSLFLFTGINTVQTLLLEKFSQITSVIITVSTLETGYRLAKWATSRVIPVRKDKQTSFALETFIYSSGAGIMAVVVILIIALL